MNTRKKVAEIADAFNIFIGWLPTFTDKQLEKIEHDASWILYERDEAKNEDK